MRKLGWVVLAALSYGSWAASIGCSGVSKQELDTVKAELLAHDEQVRSSLETKITTAQEKYATVIQIEGKVTNLISDLTALQKNLTELSKSVDDRANVATGNALKISSFEEKLLSERLAELRALIEELKKK